MCQKHPMNLIVFQNYPNVFMTQPMTSAPSYETHAFNMTTLPTEFPSKDFPVEVRGRRRSSSVDSINNSSDFVPLSDITQGTVLQVR